MAIRFSRCTTTRTKATAANTEGRVQRRSRCRNEPHSWPVSLADEIRYDGGPAVAPRRHALTITCVRTVLQVVVPCICATLRSCWTDQAVQVGMSTGAVGSKRSFAATMAKSNSTISLGRSATETDALLSTSQNSSMGADLRVGLCYRRTSTTG